MALVLISVFGAAAVGLAAGRRPPIGPVEPPWVSLALAVAGVVFLLGASKWLATILVGYSLLIAAAATQWRRTGMVVVTAGLFANLAVIAWDRGMPVKGLAAGTAAGPLHHALRAGDRLVGLADIIHLPLLSEMASPGDVALALGAAVVMFGWLEPRGRRRPVGA